MLHLISGGMSDHYLVESLLRIDGRWNKRKNERHREVLRVSKLYDKEKEREYKMSIGNVWSEVKEREGERVEEEWQCFKDEIMKCAKGVCGMRRVGGVRRKGSEWWSDEVREAVEEKNMHMKNGCREEMRRLMKGIKRRRECKTYIERSKK